jgi:signal transduction histidine kinase
MVMMSELTAGVVRGSTSRALKATVAVVAALVVCAGTVVIALRIANLSVEPEGLNWWLVAWFMVAAVFGVTGAVAFHQRRLRSLGAAFLLIAATALVCAVATQYGGFAAARPQHSHWSWLADATDWSRPLLAGLLAGVVPWLLLPAGTGGRLRRIGVTTAVALTALVTVAAASHGPLDTALLWCIAVAAAVADIVHVRGWWRQLRVGADPFVGWLTGGCVVAWLALMPDAIDVARWQPPGRDVLAPLLLMATVPLLAGGTAILIVRDTPTRFQGVSHEVVEWTLLSAGIVAVYTGLVAGLGRLVGGSGPTWLLVAATGGIALVLEPARRRISGLVDHLVYGARNDPLAVVQGVIDRVGSDTGDDLLPALAANLQDELRLTSVAIDLRVGDGWQPAAHVGAPSTQTRELPLEQHGELIGRLTVGWDDGPSLRPRDNEVLTQLVGPLSLAVSWVRLAAELRRLNTATLSAREEERRRLRRDLHDGIGPTLTGASLGLRTAVRQLERDPTLARAAPLGLLNQVADEVDGMVVELRRIVRDLVPTALDEFGLVRAVTEFAHTFDGHLPIHLSLPDADVELPAAVELAAYRIVTEALTNVVRHSRAAQCWLTIEAGEQVEIDVADDGVGIDGSICPGVGLTAMRERATLLGGSVHVVPNEPHGTRVHVELPAVLP